MADWGYVAGTVQIANVLLLWPFYFKGMTTEEISHMTMKMVQARQQFDLSAMPGIKVDKHSTGGAGDKVTLVLVVAGFRSAVAKMNWSWPRPHRLRPSIVGIH